MAMTFQLNDSAHAWGIDDFATSSADSLAWDSVASYRQSWGSGDLWAGESGYITSYYWSGFDSEMDVLASSPYTTTITAVDLFAGATALWQMRGAVEVDESLVGAGLDEELLLAGNDTILGNRWNNKLEGFAGDDYIDGGAGTDTAVLAGSIYENSYALDGGIIRTAGPDGFDRLVGIERLEFDDYGVAFDVQGTAGKAYRLYQAAFDREPDLGGLGYQMNALDSGLTLSQVAGNFVASPEFQWRYGFLDNTHFVVQLYANVLDRAPDAGGLAYHVARLNAGVPRGEVLVGFSESPENQANVIGQIADGMLYVPLA